MDGPGFHVEPDVLDTASRGMADIVRDQDATELAGVPSPAEVFGDPDLQAANDAFCDAWSVGIDGLCDRALWMGQSLADAAAAYRDAERAAGAALSGDPAETVVADGRNVVPP